MEQNVLLQEGYALKSFNTIKLKMVDWRPLLTVICVISKKPCYIARPLLQNKICSFRGGGGGLNLTEAG